MKYELVITSEAQNEIRDAIQWYRSKALYLDREFLNCLDNGFSMIKRNPLMFPIVHKNYRRILIRRFPYQIIYTLQESTILVLAVFHAKRNPEGWKNR
ncbi:MAG: type II toxin-antitoxin system RelE/ParE family toxin [Spirochaetales bacterium]|nr:type II toxin-antitoxin system RelE/ParE family toxin [Spirochaetales bacterium]